MDEFTKAYLVCALWSSIGDNDEPLDKDFSVSDIHPDALREMQVDCQGFQDTAWNLISSDPVRAGHDFWLTRNGHGTGFWDGDWPKNGDALTKASEEYGECILYVGDDNKVHVY